uniref:2-C-methyl-D-erythritol 2,4-cyclodiphosphate synthase n=1 Tax=candidate division WOR-3 bacterium TaxID=2052148 RepID=A0A7V6CNB0_UNCW3
MREIKIGFGFDSHPLRKKRKLIIGGIEIPFKYGLFGHSDADILFHALADALLSAIGDYDIGYYFPPTDKKLKGISSTFILKEVNKKIKKDGYQVKNISAVIVINKPRLLPYLPQMKKNISEILKIKEKAIGISFKTWEGFLNNKVAACFCTVLLEKR